MQGKQEDLKEKLMKHDLNTGDYLQDLSNLFPEVKLFLFNLKFYLFTRYYEGFSILSFYRNKTEQGRTNCFKKCVYFPFHLHL